MENKFSSSILMFPVLIFININIKISVLHLTLDLMKRIILELYILWIYTGGSTLARFARQPPFFNLLIASVFIAMTFDNMRNYVGIYLFLVQIGLTSTEMIDSGPKVYNFLTSMKLECVFM